MERALVSILGGGPWPRVAPQVGLTSAVLARDIDLAAAASDFRGRTPIFAALFGRGEMKESFSSWLVEVMRSLTPEVVLWMSPLGSPVGPTPEAFVDAGLRPAWRLALEQSSFGSLVSARWLVGVWTRTGSAAVPVCSHGPAAGMGAGKPKLWSKALLAKHPGRPLDEDQVAASAGQIVAGLDGVGAPVMIPGFPIALPAEPLRVRFGETVRYGVLRAPDATMSTWGLLEAADVSALLHWPDAGGVSGGLPQEDWASVRAMPDLEFCTMLVRGLLP